MEYAELDVWVLVDEGGDYVVAKDNDAVGELYEDDIGSLQGVATRRVKLTVKVPLPRAVEVAVVLPDEPQDATVSVQ